jgi:hypothetical protein
MSVVIIMHIYNWCHSITTSILLYTRGENKVYMYTINSPCYFFPFAPLFNPSHLLGTLLAVTGSVHLIPRLLIN